MHRRALGETSLTVPVLGIGSSPFRHHTPESGARLLERAMDLGVDYYDTARSYVNGEEAVACLPPDRRNALLVTTKTGARGGKFCLADLQRSLNTLKRRWIDVWMTHMVESEEDYEQCVALGGFCDIAIAARQAGLVRATGASFHAHTGLIERAIRERAFDVVMFPFNLIGRETRFGSPIRDYRERLLPAARAQGVGVVVMKVLAGGEMARGAPGLRFVTDAATGRTAIGGAVRWATMNPAIATSVVGMATERELEANVAAVRGVNDDMTDVCNAWTREADALAAGPCTRCGACLPVCPEGIEIPKVMRLYDQQRFFGMDGVARAKYAAMERDAAACTQCAKCNDVCPPAFDIAGELRRAHESLRAPARPRVTRRVPSSMNSRSMTDARGMRVGRNS